MEGNTVQRMRCSGAIDGGDGRRTWSHCTGLREGVRGTQATRPSRYNDEEVLLSVGWEHGGKEEGGRYRVENRASLGEWSSIS